MLKIIARALTRIPFPMSLLTTEIETACLATAQGPVTVIYGTLIAGRISLELQTKRVGIPSMGCVGSGSGKSMHDDNTNNVRYEDPRE